MCIYTVLNCSFSCIALQSRITQHGINFLVTNITWLSVAQTQFSVLHSSFSRTNWSLFLFGKHWPISRALPNGVQHGVFHHLPFLWATLCGIIKSVLAGNCVIHSFFLWYATIKGHSKRGSELSQFSLVTCLFLQKKKIDLKIRFIMVLNLYLPLKLMIFFCLRWLVLAAQPLKHFCYYRLKWGLAIKGRRKESTKTSQDFSDIWKLRASSYIHLNAQRLSGRTVWKAIATSDRDTEIRKG